jgi:hypothetical protein
MHTVLQVELIHAQYQKKAHQLKNTLAELEMVRFIVIVVAFLPPHLSIAIILSMNN